MSLCTLTLNPAESRDDHSTYIASRTIWQGVIRETVFAHQKNTSGAASVSDPAERRKE